MNAVLAFFKGVAIKVEKKKVTESGINDVTHITVAWRLITPFPPLAPVKITLIN